MEVPAFCLVDKKLVILESTDNFEQFCRRPPQQNGKLKKFFIYSDLLSQSLKNNVSAFLTDTHRFILDRRDYGHISITITERQPQDDILHQTRHDLKNTLHGIHGYLALIKMTGLTDAQMKTYCERLEEGIRLLNAGIDEKITLKNLL
jgi:hypothetical protein